MTFPGEIIPDPFLTHCQEHLRAYTDEIDKLRADNAKLSDTVVALKKWANTTVEGKAAAEVLKIIEETKS